MKITAFTSLIILSLVACAATKNRIDVPESTLNESNESAQTEAPNSDSAQKIIISPVFLPENLTAAKRSTPTTKDSAQQEYNEAIAANDTEKLRHICVSSNNALACNFFKKSCDKKNAVGCLWMAGIEAEIAPTEYLKMSKYKIYIDLACHYKNKQACTIQKQLKQEEREQEKIHKIHNRVICAMTPQEVAWVLGTSDATSGCTDNIHTAFRYGRRWIFFKSDGAFLIMDHENYLGACLEGRGHYPNGYKGWFICKKE